MQHLSTTRWSTPAKILSGIAATLLGIALFALPLSVQQLAVVTGAGLALVGVVLALRVSEEDRASQLLTRLTGAALVIAGALMALWPDAGAPWLALLVAVALMLHGVVSCVAALRGDRDHRAASVLIALAGIALGVLALSWPVLTLSLFRLAVGAWLVFSGVRAVVETLRERRGRESGHATRQPNPVSGDPGHDRQPPTHESLSSIDRQKRPIPRGKRTPRSPLLATWSRTIGASLALVLAVGAAFGSAQLFAGTPQPLTTDFYTPPEQVPAEAGRLIRTEPLTVGVPSGAQAWRMLYTTTRADGSAAVSSGTILAPANLDEATEPLPLLSVSHGTTGIVDGCAPSLSAAPFADGAGTAMAEMVTSHGWVAVTSDYVGMGTAGTTAYLVGDEEARNVLDASRAVLEFDELNVTSETVVWGHSQGGQGSLWTGQVASDYAPELELRGIAAFAPAADLFGLAEANKTTAAGKIVSAYIATTWNEVFPQLGLSSDLTPGSTGPTARISALCFNGHDVLSAILLGTQVPNQIFPNSVLDGAFGELLKEQEPVGPFPAPVLVAQGLADPLVLPDMQQKWVDHRCDAGEAIDYRTFEGLSHVSLVAADSPLTPQIVEWTLDRWNGELAPTACTSQEFPESS